MKFYRRLAVIAAAAIITSFTSSSFAQTKADFVFVIDATGSMAGEIAGVRNGFSNFVSGLNAADVEARFSIVLFGGAPELVLDFTDDASVASTAFSQISTSGAVSGFQNNHNVNPEAGLEAIRMVLNEAPNSTLATNNLGTAHSGILNYRSDARKNIIFVTDEDSDNSFYTANRFTGQSGNEPPSNGEGNSNWGGWQAEIDATAQAVIDNDAFLNMLINRFESPTRYQYGDYIHDVADSDLLNFDAAATLANLQADSVTNNSLQTQVLEAGLIARTFNVTGANDSDFVDNFFAAKIEETVTNPVEVPEPSFLILLLTGLMGLRYSQRRS